MVSRIPKQLRRKEMAVKAVKPYRFTPRDTVDKFPAPLLYVGWDDHMMFVSPICIPIPPDTPFQTLMDKILPDAYGMHPDFAKIDWIKVEWFKSGKPFVPEPGKTLRENGLGHKDVIRFRTPGLEGIGGAYF
jgi:phenol hydroxylase P4 protein